VEQQTFKKILQMHVETAIPDDHDPWPIIHGRLMPGHQTAAGAEERVPLSRNRKTVKRLSTLALCISLLLLVFLAWTPTGRALARSVIRFFQTTDQNSYPVPAEFASSASQLAEPSTPVPTSVAAIVSSAGEMECDPDRGQGTLMCEIRLLEDQLGFPIQVLPLQAAELVVEKLDPDPNSQSLTIYYTNPYSLSVSLRQGLGDFPPDDTFDRVPPDGVRAVRIAGSPGEIVRGMFVQWAGEDQMEWWPSAPILRLRWSDGQRWYEMGRFGTPEFSPVLDEAELIWMAEHLELGSSMADSSEDAGSPTTAQLAESQAGIDVKIPVLVPDGFHFRYAQVPDEAGRVMLVYSTHADPGPRGFMVINETREGSDARWFGTAKVTHVTVGQTDASYVAGYNRGGESPYSPAELLAWSADGLDFEILHFTTAEDGYNMRLRPEGVVAVAESLR